MQIEVYGLNKILKVVKNPIEQVHLISIRDRYSDEPTIAKYACLDRRIARNGVDALNIYFDDIDPYRFYHDMEHPCIKEKFADPTHEPIFFNPEIAKEIVNWCYERWEQDPNVNIKVHCWAGKSRSQAVAYWLNMYFNLRMSQNNVAFVENNAKNVTDKVHFNCEVLKVFTQVYG